MNPRPTAITERSRPAEVRTGAQEQDPTASPDTASPIPLRALPVAIPAFGLLILLVTGLVWVGILWGG